MERLINGKRPMLICEIPNRKPNPGICTVLYMDFEERRLEWSNGIVRSTAKFEDCVIKQLSEVISEVIKDKDVYSIIEL